MSVLHEDLAEIKSLLAGARSTQDVFPAMALTVSVNERLVLLEEEYVVCVRRLQPERFAGNSLAQNSARRACSQAVRLASASGARARADASDFAADSAADSTADSDRYRGSL